ncbi:MAG: caspase family protein [Spirochaetia bacterium]|nr:caspase family protein [Spirochaetia bacterium]
MIKALKVFIYGLSIVFMLSYSASCFLITPSPEYTGTKRALVYGVADYTLINDLTYTYHDAYDMSVFLSLHGFDVTVKYNNEVTKNSIMAELETVRLAAGPDDILVFHFSGHGDGYFRNDDSTLDNPFILPPEEFQGQASIIPDITAEDSGQVIYETELLDMLAEIPGKKLVILDICHAGGFVPDDGITVDRLPGDYEYTGDDSAVFKTWDKYFSYTGESVYPDIWVIASAGANELAYESGMVENGFFTYHLLEGLGFNHDESSIDKSIPADANGDGLVTVSELYAEVFSRFETHYNKDSSLTRVGYDPYYSHLSGGSRDLILLHTN